MIVVNHVAVDDRSELSGGGDFIDIDPIIFQGPEETFGPCIVQTLALSIHADPNAVPLQKHAVVWIREVSTLITVDDFWLVSGQGAVQAIEDKGLVQGA